MHACMHAGHVSSPFDNVATYLKRPEVLSALGVDPKHAWSDCNRVVALEFELTGDWMHDFETMLPEQARARDPST